MRWRIDNPDSVEDKNARVIELIAAYRRRGHLMADIDPLRLDKDRFRSHPDLDVQTHGLTLWDLDRVFKVNGFAGCEYKKLRDVLGLLRDSYCRHVGVEYGHILEPEQQQWLQERVEAKDMANRLLPSRSTSCPSSTPPRRSRPSWRPNMSGRSGSRWRAPRPSSR